MKKLISFKQIKEICAYEEYDWHISGNIISSLCDHKDGINGKCNSKNCPIWRKLKDRE